MILQHNIASLNVQRQLGLVGANKATSTAKLASGYRINKAADDAAGLAVSEKLRSQVRGLTRASENVEDGMSYVRTADGALNEVSNMLQRMRELSVQASNIAVNEVGDRMMIQQEINEIRGEINRVFTDTEFNSKKIWDPARANAEMIQVGSYTEPVLSTNRIGNEKTIITNDNRYNVPKEGSSYILAADDNGIRVSWTNQKGNTITTDNIPWPIVNGQTDVYANMTFDIADYLSTAKNQIQDGTSLDGIHATFTIKGNPNASKEQVLTSYNSLRYPTNINSTEKAIAYDSNGNAIQSSWGLFFTTIPYSTELESAKDMEKGDTSFIEPASDSNFNKPTNNDETWTISFTMEQDGEGKSPINLTGKITNSAFSSPDRSEEVENIWWYRYKYTNYQGQPMEQWVGLSKSLGTTLGGFQEPLTRQDTLNILSNTHGLGGTYVYTFTLYDDQNRTKGSVDVEFKITPEDCRLYSTDPELAVKNIVDRFNKISKIDIYNNSVGNYDGANLSSRSYSYIYSSYSNNAKVTLPIMESAGVIDEYIQAGANAQQGIRLKYRYLSGTMLGIRNTNVETFEGAQAAIEQVDKALGIVAEERSRFGAYENRLEYADRVDKNTAENLQAAESRLRDTDMSEEMAKFSKEDILEQASVAMLAQANQSTQSVLSLLG